MYEIALLNSNFYIKFIIIANQPATNNKPPKGVTGPRNLIFLFKALDIDSP